MRTTLEYLIGGHHVSKFQRSTGEEPHRYKGSLRQLSGFTLVELMIVVGIIGLLAAIAVPNFIRSRKTAQTDVCIAHLRQLDECKQQWAMEHQKNDDSMPTKDDVLPYLRDNELPSCPASGEYRLRRVARAPVCSLSPGGHTLLADEDALPD